MAKTRKARTIKKHDKVLTIPQLRSSMEHMDGYSQKLVATKSLKDGAKLFASEWKRVFGKVIPLKSAEDYLKNKMKLRKYGKTRRRKYRGGGPIAGAPLDHITRAGDYNMPTTTAVYPPLVAKGFWTPQSSILFDSETQQGVLPYPNTGNNNPMAGGGLMSTLGSAANAAFFRPTIAQNPVSSMQSTMLSFKGLPTGPGADSYDNPNLKV